MARKRLNTEVCDYCYHERVNKSRSTPKRKRVNIQHIRCVCSNTIQCKSTLCAYGSSIGGEGGITAGTRKKQHQTSE